MRATITRFVRRCVSGALPLLLMTNPFVSPGPAVVAAFSFLFGSAPSALAAATATRKTYDLPSGDAVDTLRRFAEESDKQIVYLLDTVRGVATTAIRGEFTARDALQAMLADTGLAVVEDTKTGALMVNRVAVVSAPSERPAGKVKRLSPLAVLGGWQLTTLVDYTRSIFQRIPGLFT